MRWGFRYGLLTLLVPSLSACATGPVDVTHEEDRAYRVESPLADLTVCDALTNHIIAFDEEGRYQRFELTNVTTASGQPCRQPPTLGAHVGNIIDGAKRAGLELVLIIHGGLVSRTSGLEQALSIAAAMERDRHQYGYARYPVFLNWRSGGVEAYRDQLLNIRKGERDPVLGRVTAPLVLGSDLLRGVAGTPASATLEGKRLVDTLTGELRGCDPPSNSSHRVTVVCPRVEEPSGETLETTLYVAGTPVRIVTAPVINGPGRSAWENMLRRTRNPFWREDGDRVVLGDLSRSMQMLAGDPDLDLSRVGLSLIGHSMGTMVASELMYAHPRVKYNNVVFMAAAVSVRDFQHTAATVINQGQPGGRFYSLSLLPWREARELSVKGLVPSGSLLEWIDEMYETPPTRFERTLGKWENVRHLLHTFRDTLQPAMTFKIFGTQSGEPSVHGAFNDVSMCFWRDTFWRDSDWTTHYNRCRAELIVPLNLE